MTFLSDDKIASELQSIQNLKETIDRTGIELKNLRSELSKDLQSANLIKKRGNSDTWLRESMPNLHLGEDDDLKFDFQHLSDSDLEEHARRAKPSLVVFGPNSSGKTSFIRCFLGLGNILPSGIGPVSARIVQLTYAPAHQASFRVYDTIEQRSVLHDGSLSYCFEDLAAPDWQTIADLLLSHVQRPSDISENSPDFSEWAKCFVQVSLPSPTLKLGIDVYDTPGFLSDNREHILTDNLHQLAKRLKPTLLFLYDNPTISDTDKSCFLAMKNALGSMERVPVFFLNTKADCMSIVNDYQLDDDPDNVSFEEFNNALNQKRQHCYELLLRRAEMANEVLGRMPPFVNDCACFDLCSIPGNYDPWQTFTDLITQNSFQRILTFASTSYKFPSEILAKNILDTIEDYFDLVVSTGNVTNVQWDSSLDEARKWGEVFFDEYQKIIPTLTDALMENLGRLLDQEKPEITRKAASTSRSDDPIGELLENKTKTIQSYIRLALEEQVLKVAANRVIIDRGNEIKQQLATNFQRSPTQGRNHLLSVAQRQVLGEISPTTLQDIKVWTAYLNDLIKLPARIARFCRSVPTRLNQYRKDLYNHILNQKIKDGDQDVYAMLDAMDAYATLSNEQNRLFFANQCFEKVAEELKNQKDVFSRTLDAWICKQKEEFLNRLDANYKYVTKHLSDFQQVRNIIWKYSGSFAKLKCRLLAAIDLTQHGGIPPQIGDELGRGGFYSIHACHWTNRDGLAAKKLLELSPESQAMMALEIHYHRLAFQLCPNHIAPVLYVYENKIDSNNHELWLIMPRYSLSLQQYLMRNNGQIPFPLSVRFALTIAKTLSDLHRMAIAHRDLKSNNIMLDEHEQCYLIDFGTAKVGLFNRTLVGTLPLPPEMVTTYTTSNPNLTIYDGAAADIYTFGLLLYEMLPKQSYDRLDRESLERLDNKLTCNALPDDNQQFYTDLIRKCLNKEPNQRPTGKQLVIDLEKIKRNTEIKPCMMCDDRQRTIRLKPCSHKVACDQCWNDWSARSDGFPTCILCKVQVTNQIRDDATATFYVQRD